MEATTSPRVKRTDRALSTASVQVAAEDGWADFTFARVAERAGTSRRPLQDRYSGRSELAAATWRESAEPMLRRRLVEVMAASGLLEAPPDRDRFRAVLDDLAHPSLEIRAAVELLIVAQFDDLLGAAVADTLGREIAHWCTPGELRCEDAARRAYMLSFALGLVLVARRPGVEPVDVERMADVFLAALAEPVKPSLLPDVEATHIDDPVAFNTGDVVRDRLLQSALDEVGARGYDAATVDSIAHRAGSSQGALFARYPTKVALFVDAARRQSAHALRANEDWMQRLASEHGLGIAEAAMIREFQRPGRHHLRVITLEQLRTAWHEPVVAEMLRRETEAFVAEAHAVKPSFNVAEVHAGFALGGGTLLLSILWPDAWLLPYDVVTVAWEG